MRKPMPPPSQLPVPSPDRIQFHPPPPPVDLRTRLEVEGYPALLADHVQLVCQVENLTVAVVALWEQNCGLRTLLDLPVEPLPLAVTMAASARPMPARLGGDTSRAG